MATKPAAVSRGLVEASYNVSVDHLGLVERSQVRLCISGEIGRWSHGSRNRVQLIWGAGFFRVGSGSSFWRHMGRGAIGDCDPDGWRCGEYSPVTVLSVTRSCALFRVLDWTLAVLGWRNVIAHAGFQFVVCIEVDGPRHELTWREGLSSTQSLSGHPHVVAQVPGQRTVDSHYIERVASEFLVFSRAWHIDQAECDRFRSFVGVCDEQRHGRRIPRLGLLYGSYYLRSSS